MNREEQIGMTEVHKQKGIRYNSPVFNAFNSKLVGWVNPQDALVNLGNEEEFFEHNKWASEQPWEEDPMGINKHNFRCDDFTSEHDGEHLLFSGCSVTYGVGLYTKELWSHKLYEMIKKDKKVSGYFNLGTPGTSVMAICSNIMKYISNYGKPDAIFLDLPDLNRFYIIPKEEDVLTKFEKLPPYAICQLLPNWIRHGTYNGMPIPEVEVNKIHTYNYLRFLQQYCEEAGIKLYIFSYVMETTAFLKMTDIERLFDFNNDSIVDDLYEYSQKNKTDEYFLIARDKRHHGTAFHDAWAKLMYDAYTKEHK
jgi:hypothetical protein